ncbi:microsomal signal peptidase 12 kDa subunit-domain-containing protein [Mortierella sp. GBAus27b]|nr:hypothetical protein BGX31_011609 [Mortierella sp. GBA43]KAI8355515.1 microsomal signal peptidase 12 kDa subunit-domain-containing protein [Mortierella sp. GBAus27b]
MFEYHIDYHGQRLSDRLNQGIISAFGVIGFLVGFFLQDIFLTLYIFGAGIAVTALVVIPAWPPYNKNQLRWLSSRAKAAEELKKAEAEAAKAKDSKEEAS